MYLKFIEEGTHLTIRDSEESGKHVYQAVFSRLESDTSFYARSEELYNDFDHLSNGTQLIISFFRGANMYTFSGVTKSVRQEVNSFLTLIEQVSGIEVSNRREYDRNEMRRDVSVFAPAPGSLENGEIRKAGSRPEFTYDMFDISVGGMCLVSNEKLNSSSGAHFLLEFSLSDRDEFLLPAKLVRKSTCPQTSLYRYDYGFEFIYDHTPNEKDRLIMAIFNAKMAAFKRW